MRQICTSDAGTANSGWYSCNLKSFKPRGLIFVPRGAVILDADTLTDITDKFKLPAPEDRWYPFFDENLNLVNNSTQVTYNSLNNYQEKEQDGNAIFQFQYPFGLCTAKGLVTYEEYAGGLYVITSDNRIVGNKTANGLEPFYPRLINTDGDALGANGTVSTVRVDANFGSSIVMIKNMMCTETFNVNTTTWRGMTTVEAKISATPNKFNVFESCSGADLSKVFDGIQVVINGGTAESLTYDATTGLLTPATTATISAGQSIQVDTPTTFIFDPAIFS